MQQNEQTHLILNADDFGLTPGVNRSILELNAAGALTSATLMANGAAFREAVHGAFVQTTLDVGCHVVLVDGQPILPYTQIPSLANASGFRPTLGAFLKDLQLGRIRAGDMEAEATAQIRRIQSAGITVSHLDSHKHTHMFARVLEPVLRAAHSSGVRAIRNPFEPAWSVRATEAKDMTRRVQVMLLRTRRRRFVTSVKRAGLATTDGAIGVLATGELTAGMLRRMLAAMPAGTWELVCHPGFQDDALLGIHTRLRQSREVEHAALREVFSGEPNHRPLTISFSALGAESASFRRAGASYGRR
jgi:predicted glycoside hydrolase/deacetylase ChbG (UPF0249 family)